MCVAGKYCVTHTAGVIDKEATHEEDDLDVVMKTVSVYGVTGLEMWFYGAASVVSQASGH